MAYCRRDLRLQIPPMTAVPPTPFPVADALTTRPVILVVDDTGGVRSVLTRALLHSGYHVITSAGETESMCARLSGVTSPGMKARATTS